MSFKQKFIQLQNLRYRKTILCTAGAMIVAVSLGLLLHSAQKKSIQFIQIEEETQKQPVTLNIAGKKYIVYTQGRTVGDVLQEQNIHVNPLDQVNPALNQPVSGNQTITLTRVTKRMESQLKTVAFNTQKKAEHTMMEGQTKVVQKGQPGKVLEGYEVVYTNGKPTGKKLITSKVIQPEKDQVVAIGTSRMVALSRGEESSRRAMMTDGTGNADFTPRKVLHVTMTAYSSDPASNGTTANDPARMITKSGTTLKEGRTIAVDPDVVPLGWWVYIEGYGFRRAEDTGGAIKGNRVDLYFTSEEDARNFGIREKKLYVIGPHKP
ncbi:3D domain-containing protein [Aneurinibacillus terranovensis]|uniref:3D domain-containing protein n=1 Tax=Aneurinibacillus terranovensis TaxID=278991 RepID=UPI0003F8392A|nr:3D domain-containing protein [Aneurinibacillus terranovensis]